MEDSLRNFCITLAQSVANEFGLQLVEGDGQLESIVTSLEAELRAGYENKGYPYGDTEEDMVRYLRETTIISVE